MSKLRVVPAAVAALAVLGAACSNTESATPDQTPSGSAASSGSAGTTAGTTRQVPDRPDGPAADLSEELTGGGGAFIGAATGLDVPEGYVQEEFVASGTATDYSVEGEFSEDGRWTFVPDTTAPYRTRVLVRRPEDPADASGTVIVEWLNVSGGVDANPDYASFEEELVREGHTWVGVSAQLIGVEGGPVLVAPPGVEELVGKGLVTLDPERYGTLDHPGDGYAFDIFTQVARAVRNGDAAFGGSEPEVILAAGESQSAIALTTYYDGVQPLTEAFDGFFVHSRAFASLPLVGPDEYADLAGAMVSQGTVQFRTDLTAPVLDLQAEGDVTGLLNSVLARQPDSETFRLWEVAGTSHADRHLLGVVADNLDCGAAINDGPMHLVAKAALVALDDWVRTGEAPPEMPRLEVSDGDAPTLVRDADGIVEGGIRTPPVDAPVDVLSGEPGPSTEIICQLMGSTVPLDAAALAERYADAAAYQAAYDAAVDDAIDAGVVLDGDREALEDLAQPDRIS